jgi:putative transposase
MHRIDKLHMEFPFAGSRMMQGLLVHEGFEVGRLHVAAPPSRDIAAQCTAGRRMKRRGIEALYRRPNT